MKERGRRGRKGDSIGTSPDGYANARYDAMRNVLKRYLVHTREVVNGKDFLFLGPRDEIHAALSCVIEHEHQNNRFAHADFAEVNGYFLLRLVGFEEDQQRISQYFE